MEGEDFDRHYAEEAIELLEKEIDTCNRRIADESRYAERLRRAAEDLRNALARRPQMASGSLAPDLLGDLPVGKDRPRTIDLVRELLASEPHNHMSAKYIVKRLDGHGALAHLKRPYNTVLEAAKRLAERDPNIYRVDQVDGTFFVYSEQEPAYDAAGNVVAFTAPDRT